MIIHSHAVEKEIRLRMREMGNALIELQNDDIKAPLFEIVDQAQKISLIAFALIRQEEF